MKSLLLVGMPLGLLITVTQSSLASSQMRIDQDVGVAVFMTPDNTQFQPIISMPSEAVVERPIEMQPEIVYQNNQTPANPFFDSNQSTSTLQAVRPGDVEKSPSYFKMSYITALNVEQSGSHREQQMNCPAEKSNRQREYRLDIGESSAPNNGVKTCNI